MLPLYPYSCFPFAHSLIFWHDRPKARKNKGAAVPQTCGGGVTPTSILKTRNTEQQEIKISHNLRRQESPSGRPNSNSSLTISLQTLQEHHRYTRRNHEILKEGGLAAIPLQNYSLRRNTGRTSGVADSTAQALSQWVFGSVHFVSRLSRSVSPYGCWCCWLFSLRQLVFG